MFFACFRIAFSRLAISYYVAGECDVIGLRVWRRCFVSGFSVRFIDPTAWGVWVAALSLADFGRVAFCSSLFFVRFPPVLRWRLPAWGTMIQGGSRCVLCSLGTTFRFDSRVGVIVFDDFEHLYLCSMGFDFALCSLFVAPRWASLDCTRISLFRGVRLSDSYVFVSRFIMYCRCRSRCFCYLIIFSPLCRRDS